MQVGIAGKRPAGALRRRLGEGGQRRLADSARATETRACRCCPCDPPVCGAATHIASRTAMLLGENRRDIPKNAIGTSHWLEMNRDEAKPRPCVGRGGPGGPRHLGKHASIDDQEEHLVAERDRRDRRADRRGPADDRLDADRAGSHRARNERMERLPRRPCRRARDRDLAELQGGAQRRQAVGLGRREPSARCSTPKASSSSCRRSRRCAATS